MNRKQRRANEKLAKNSVPNTIELNQQKLANALRSLQDQVNNRFDTISRQLTAHNNEIGNIFDVIEAIVMAKKVTIPSEDKWNKYCQEKMEGYKIVPTVKEIGEETVGELKEKLELDEKEYPPLEAMMDSMLEKFESAVNNKVLNILNFMQRVNTVPDEVFTQFIYNAYDKRNNLITLGKDQKPEKGDFCFMVWQFSRDGQMIYDHKRMFSYQIGSEDFLIDDILLESKAGDQKTIDLTFGEKAPVKELANQAGQFTFKVLMFKRQTQANADPQNISEEDKKKIWKEKYQAETIK